MPSKHIVRWVPHALALACLLVATSRHASARARGTEQTMCLERMFEPQ